jgi:membrane-associated protein
VTYNVVGGILWVWSMVLAGYLLARSIPDIERHIHIVIVVVILLSLLPGFIELYRARQRARRAAAGPSSPRQPPP